jgi:hypothetical protein
MSADVVLTKAKPATNVEEGGLSRLYLSAESNLRAECTKHASSAHIEFGLCHVQHSYRTHLYKMSPLWIDVVAKATVSIVTGHFDGDKS